MMPMRSADTEKYDFKIRLTNEIGLSSNIGRVHSNQMWRAIIDIYNG